MKVDQIDEYNEVNNSSSFDMFRDFSAALSSSQVPGSSPTNPLYVLENSFVNLNARVYNSGSLDAGAVAVSYTMASSNLLLGQDFVQGIARHSYSSSSIATSFSQAGDYTIRISADHIHPQRAGLLRAKRREQ